MEQMRVVRGSNVQAQMKSVDTILARLSRRQEIKKNYFVSPIVFSNYVEEIPEDGAIMRFLVGVHGKLSMLSIIAETIPKDVKGGEISVRIATHGIVKTESAWAKKGKGTIEDDIAVEPLSQVTISFSEPLVKNIWVSVLVIPEIDGRYIKSERITGDE